MRFALVLLPILALAACNGGNKAGGTGGNSSAPVQTSAPVAGVPAPAGKQWTDVVEKTKDNGFRQGNPNAPIKLVEYGSRMCPFCAQFGTTGVGPLREKYISTGKVSYEYRDFLIHGAPDLALALLNQCVPTDAFFPTLDQIYAGQEEFEKKIMALQQTNPQVLDQIQQMPPPQAAAGFAQALGMVDFMKQRGLPEAQAKACLADQKQIETIAKVNADGANVYGVNSTPTFFINGQKTDVNTWTDLEPLLQKAGAR
ncbi:thioredoxin domain-containing protein [Sphingomonas sp. TDK1]|uniref:thioredoxin domain-containing protein n=1 Tax=Sphingomonas sp. TDK1 TaxID=453247 RepID=UPI0007D92303|nr:thioredoxin domain-containing protein [Sphingomonas sp. TDK1]OAN66284.1 protein-disulfide isomerase [Sphingomonas sp. TDK1]